MNTHTLSIIIPVFNEEELLQKTIIDIIVKTQEIDINCFLVIIDDGSKDKSWQIITMLAKDHPKLVKGIRFSQNYGKDFAILAGIKSIETELYLVMDADGEHPVEIINLFLNLYIKGNCDVVHGIKKGRRGKKWSIFLSKFFNHLFKIFTHLDLAESSDYKLFNKKFRNALISYRDYDYFFRAVAQHIGFQSKYLLFDEKMRIRGKSSWKINSRVKYALNAIINHSHYPLFLILFLGGASISLSVIIGLKACITYLFGDIPKGYLTLLILSLATLGTLMTSLGVLGVYLSKIFDEVRQRPRYIIQNTIGYTNLTDEPPVSYKLTHQNNIKETIHELL